jgi:hypothetical protein
MRLSIAITISIFLFTTGIVIQSLEMKSPTYNYQFTSTTLLYVSMYLLGIFFIPISNFVSKVIKKTKK